MSSHAHFLDAVEALGQVRRKLDRYILDAAPEYQEYGILPRVGDRVVLVPQARQMVEATFRLLKYVQFGDYANHRDAVELWASATRALDRGPAQADLTSTLDRLYE